MQIICDCGDEMTLNVCDPSFREEQYIGYDCSSCGGSFYGIVRKGRGEEIKNKVFLVYYSKNLQEALLGKQKVDINFIDKTHILVSRCFVKDLDQVFHDFQGEIWSPNGEMRPLIEALGLRHTSMSVGDVVFDTTNCSWWRVAPTGWEELR